MGLFTKCIDPVEKCLEDAGLGKFDIDDVVLVGGSTRIPKVQQLLRDMFFRKELCKGIHPDEAVAYGAAIHAAILCGKVSNENIVLVDVAPLSLGVELHNGDMKVIVPRNTTIPTIMEATNFVTCHNNQTVARFNVYEGERCLAEENNLLGMFNLSGIPPAPQGVQKFRVVFNIDADGILTVSAENIGTTNKKEITITHCNRGLSKEEIERMVKEAEEMRARDEEKIKKAKAKHDLEDYAIEMRDKLRDCGEGIYHIFRWLDRNSHFAEVDEFKDKLGELQRICQPFHSGSRLRDY